MDTSLAPQLDRLQLLTRAMSRFGRDIVGLAHLPAAVSMLAAGAFLVAGQPRAAGATLVFGTLAWLLLRLPLRDRVYRPFGAAAPIEDAPCSRLDRFRARNGWRGIALLQLVLLLPTSVFVVTGSLPRSDFSWGLAVGMLLCISALAYRDTSFLGGAAALPVTVSPTGVLGAAGVLLALAGAALGIVAAVEHVRFLRMRGDLVRLRERWTGDTGEDRP